MEYHEFIERVQEKAGLDSPDEALNAIKATLGTLGELLSKAEREGLAAELHKPLKEYLETWLERSTRRTNRPHRFTLEEFYHRVSARAGLGYRGAVKCSLAVISVLKQAVSQGQLNDAFRELPEEYGELLSGIPRSPVSPSIVK